MQFATASRQSATDLVTSRPAPAAQICAPRLIDTCRAELAEAPRYIEKLGGLGDRGERRSAYLRIEPPHPARQGRWDHEIEQAAAAARLPREHAAARVLNAWDHLHPIESRTVACAERFAAQRAAGWTDRAAGSLTDLRFLLAERAKLRRSFDTAAAAYQAARAAVDLPLAA